MKQGLLLSMLLFVFPLWAQDTASYVGMTLSELIEQFGAPENAFAARGNELWQDDVVFRYAAGDFYIHRDRVWLVRIQAAYGISVGDPKQAAILALGVNAQDRGDHILFPLPANAWPLMLRVNINSAGRISALYVYRTDY